MLFFIIRRLGYAVLVLLGVTVLTFLMFRLAAGDPAAALLGKNPAPAEVESLRRELGSDLPLFYGHWRTTAAFGTAEGGRDFKRRFATAEPVRVRLTGAGPFQVNGVAAPDGYTVIAPECDRVAITGGTLQKVDFERYQSSGFHSQFFRTLGELCRFSGTFPYVHFFNFGNTLTTREPIGAILRRGVGPSLGLMVPIFLGELVLGLALALLATARKDTWLDRLLLLAAVLGMSVSYLVLIIAGQWGLGYYLNWFPVWGFEGVGYLALPVIVGILSGLGGGVRFYRTVLVSELNKEYLRTARAKGLAPLSIYRKHLLRNAAVPIITHAASLLPFLFTGSLLLESFFGIPGLGYAGIEALNNSDLQMLKALTIVNAVLFVGFNLLSDLVCAACDGRITLK